ncbi:MAG TPA: glycosyltransferase [Abditibacteriaceae bacterium]
MTSISVVIPTLREEERIGTLLRALQAQEYSGTIEIVVVDGNSEDGTQDVVRDFAGVRLLNVERGTSRQRNAGAQQADGELLLFMDADCVPAPTFIANVVRSYNRWPFAVACPWFVACESPAIRAVYFVFNLLFLLGQGWLRTGSGVCIITPRRVFHQVGGFDESLHLAEDIQYIRRAARCGWHRHLLVPLQTSGRRFQQKGVWNLVKFYARITPPLLLGRFEALKKVSYEAAPYSD